MGKAEESETRSEDRRVGDFHPSVFTASRHREIADLLQFDVVELGDFGGIGGVVNLLIVDFLYPVGTEGLHAGGAGHGGGCDDFSLSSLEQGAEIDLRMQHEFLPTLAIDPKICWCVEAWGKSVVGCGDDAVIVVQGRSAYFAVRILGTEAGDMGQRHGVLRNAETVF